MCCLMLNFRFAPNIKQKCFVYFAVGGEEIDFFPSSKLSDVHSENR